MTFEGAIETRVLAIVKSEPFGGSHTSCGIASLVEQHGLWFSSNAFEGLGRGASSKPIQ